MNSLPTSDEALTRLIAGNQRFVRGSLIHPNQSPDRRLALSEGQTPFAAILGCADSRVPPDIIFDQGLGDLFVIRVAGNIVDNSVVGSLDFAVANLQVPLIMVLGHAKCGAVSATITGGDLHGHLSHIAQAIQPAVDSVRNQAGDLIDNAIRANIRMVTAQLRNSEPILASRLASGQLKIMSAYYDLESGNVEIL
jgi:carbonic anhydrase